MQDQPTIVTSAAETENTAEPQQPQDQASLSPPPADTKRENRKSLKGALAGLKTLVEKTRKSVHKVDLKYEPIHNDQYKKAEAFTSLKKDLDELEAMLPRMRQAAAILALDDNVKPSEDAPPKV
ncbi:hypothetical protein NDA11_006626 [Ustilago hordei]|uniref:Uncharacterized protein n=1 Tax=Ustilago hordei TaxID=120017 RepID=I2FTG1_USTHO|nr:uncharacterized protein UHO2_05909 [Ustilago hordei]KAJ1043716.1 hypothetical protein NDA10_005013 [Ustilago hordei]KAJ1572570.1 hypothetical protein NDA12_005998 [Ustilago hordei]KAJ1576260.1 hypothetical protein NDA15_007152 [Ustilago hordei]KAJ1593902.1 hypothetical protein NDA11_006626 [Ustilago hordei]KAJ1595347.1 hypothetical protein NDA14_002411 [Ustilago hordei]